MEPSLRLTAELGLARQAALALWALGLGAAVGLGYDLNRALRRECRSRALHAAADALFCLAAAAALFAFAMAGLDGRLRGFALCCAGAGWGLESAFFSRYSVAFLRSIVKYLVKTAQKIRGHLSKVKKIKKIEKNIFSKVRLRFKMYSDRSGKARDGKSEGSTRREAGESSSAHSSGSGGPRSVHVRRAAGRGRGDRKTRSREGRADSRGAEAYRGK